MNKVLKTILLIVAGFGLLAGVAKGIQVVMDGRE